MTVDTFQPRIVNTVRKVLAEVDVAQLLATAFTWTAQRPTQYLSASSLSE
jgi:hypothetical protein